MSGVRIWKNYNFSLFIIYIEKKTLVEMMYDIVPTKGDTYTVNESHILNQWIERII